MTNAKLEMIYKVIQGELPQSSVSKKDLQEFQTILSQAIKVKKEKKFLPWLH